MSMWKEHGLGSLDLPLANATGLTSLLRACIGERVVMVLQQENLPWYLCIDKHLYGWTERININYTLYMCLSVAVIKDIITLFSNWNAEDGYRAFCRVYQPHCYKAYANVIS